MRPYAPERTPALWLTLVPTALVGCGLLAVGAFIGVFLAPRATAVVVPLALAYGAAWVLALLRLGDPVERRPAWLVLMAVAWGATVAAAVGAGSGYSLDVLLAKAVSPEFAATWGPAFVGPTAEEPAKAAGVVLLLLAARPYLPTAWAGAMFGALVGVGFAVTEDIFYGVLIADEVLPDDAGAGAALVLLRGAVPGLVGHPLFSAAAGAGIAYAWVRTDRPRRRRLAVLAGGLAAAWVTHFAVNSPVTEDAIEAFDRVPGLTGWTGYFLVVLPPAVPVLWWLARLRRRDARAVLGLAAAAFPAALPPAEVDTLAGLRSRARVVRAARRASGPAAAEAVRRAQRARLRLAAAMARPVAAYAAPGCPPPAVRWASEAEAASGMPDAEPAADPATARVRGGRRAAPAVWLLAGAALVLAYSWGVHLLVAVLYP
jgi:RsiW-degrading membrane proteinase PrsW (M82 family)